MKKPKIVLFDFGGTIALDGELDIEKGIEAVRLLADNPEITTQEELNKLWTKMYKEISTRGKSINGYEIETPLTAIFRNLFDRTGLKFSISLTECEIAFDRHNSTRQATPHFKQLLDTLHQKGIRTAVISNIVLSGGALKAAIDELIPDNKMEFVLTSADYLFLKPAPDLFEAAAKKAGVSPHDCWYLGDSFNADVKGSTPVGMTAVHYNSASDVAFQKKEFEAYEYFAVNSWKELADRVKNL